MSRKLLILNLLAEDVVSCKELKIAGWDIIEKRTIEDAEVLLLEEKNIFVSLLIMGQCQAELMSSVEELINGFSGSEWIAILPNSCLENPVFCKSIIDLFFDYHTLPVDIRRLLVLIGHAYGKAMIRKKLKVDGRTIGKFNMIGSSATMRDLFSFLEKIKDSTAPVLVCGESGTGKELVAQAIHENSKKKNGPFIPINCGAIPPTLIQSELFGHEKGAFTGAVQKKIGKIEAASGGTVFLDEIGDLSLDLQVSLLRFLQEKTIERIGCNEVIPVDVRIIAATHVNLEDAIKNNKFREDLYYRLNVLHVDMPALRDRGGDIELLAQSFFEKFSSENNYKVKGFSQQSMMVMRSYEWPGNVRELINRIKQAIVVCEDRLISPKDLGLEKRAKQRRVISLSDAREKAELEAIRKCLEMNQNNISKAARSLGVSRVTLYRLLNKFNIII